MRVKFIKDYKEFKPSTGGGKDVFGDVEQDVATLLLEAGYIDPPDVKDVHDEAIKQVLKDRMDPAIAKLNELIEKLGQQGDGTTRPGDSTPTKGRLNDGGFGGLNVQLAAIYAACAGQGRDTRLQGQWSGFSLDEAGHVKLTAGHAGESVDSAGGFVVFPEFRREILALGLPDAVVRPRAFVLPMGSDTLKMPKIDGRSNASTLWGGVQCYWLGEGETITASRAKFGQLELRAKDLCGLTFASTNLMADSAVPLEAFLKEAFGGAIFYQEDEAFFIGSGAARPQGFLNSPALYSVTRATASQINWADIVNMYSRMYPPSISRAVWVAHPSTLPQLLQMTAGTGTSSPLIWVGNNGGATEAPPITILGRPLVFSPHCKILGAKSDLCFCDFRHYLLGDRQQLMIESSGHVAFESREIAWRFDHRVDGQVWLAGTILDRQSYETSPFIDLNVAA